MLGFVDVPGHEKFVHNMLAGATGIDFVLLVVAADDGVMPQTREHLAIVDLLGIDARHRRADQGRSRRSASGVRRSRSRSGNVLLGTRSSPERRDPAGLDGHRRRHRRSARTLFASSAERARRTRADGPLPPRGRSLASRSRAPARWSPARCCPARSRSATASSISPSRARGARALDPCAEPRRPSAAEPGERCALNLAGDGIGKDAIARGDVVLDPALHAPTDRIDADLRVLASRAEADRPMDAGAPASCRGRSRRAHRAARRRADRARRAKRRVQLVLEQPDRGRGAATASCCATPPRSARSAAAASSICARRRASAARRAACRSSTRMRIAEPRAALAALLDRAAVLRRSVGLRARPRACGRRTSTRWRTALAHRPRSPGSAARALAGGVAAPQAQRWSRRSKPSTPTIPTCRASGCERLRLQLEPRLPAPAFAACCRGSHAQHEVALDGAWVRLPGHEVRLTPPDEELWSEIEPLLGGAERFRPPRVRDIAGVLSVAGSARCAAC